MKFAMMGFSLMALVIWAAIRIGAGISFDLKCTQYLRRAANANTVEFAASNLDSAIQHLETRRLTNGITSIILRQPSNDIGYWYQNLKASREELKKVGENAALLETSNVLMKLRETLTDDNGDTGTKVIFPEGISIYPWNALVFWIAAIATIMLVFSIWFCD